MMQTQDRVMVTEDYVSFETAKLLKEKGFDQECGYATSWYAKQYYKNPCVGEWFEGKHYIIEDIDDKYSISYLSEKDVFIPAPTLQMAMKWLRECRGISVDIITDWEWVRDPMAPAQDNEYPDISMFTGYYYEIHQLHPHRLLYDSPIISYSYSETESKAIAKALEFLEDEVMA